LITAEESRRSLRPAVPADAPIFPPPPQGLPQLAEVSADDADPDAIDDDDVPEDGSEMAIDTQPLLNHHNIGLNAPGTIPAPPPIPAAPQGSQHAGPDDPFAYVAGLTFPSQSIHPSLATTAPVHSFVSMGQVADGGNGGTQGPPSAAGQTSSAGTGGHSASPPAHALIDISSEPGPNGEPGPAQGNQGPPAGGFGGA
jgi:F-box and leucine-rich repeat protein GRR1